MSCHAPLPDRVDPEFWRCDTCAGDLAVPYCGTCGHTIRQHELRAGGKMGCIIYGCNCIDFTDFNA